MSVTRDGDGPRPKDRVRVIYEGDVAEFDEGRIARITGEGSEGQWVSYVPTIATVEIVERADDPSKDLTGSIRHTGTITCIAREPDDSFDHHRWIAVESNESFTDEHMRGTRVIGAVPGTPAAANDPAEFMREVTKAARLVGESTEDYQARMVRTGVAHESRDGFYHFGALKDCATCSVTPPSVRVVNEPHGPSPDVRQQIAELVKAGNMVAAVKAVKDATHWLLDDCHQYVRDMSEYQSYLSEHGHGGERLTCPGCGSADPDVRRMTGEVPTCRDGWHGEWAS